MKKKPPIGLIAGAIVCAGLAFYLINSQISAAKKSNEDQVARLKAELETKGKTVSTVAPPTKDVVFVNAPVAFREEIKEAILTTKPVLLDSIPEDAIMSKEDAIGKLAVVPLDAQDMLRKSKIKAISEFGGVAYKLKPGMRAVALPVAPDDPSTAAGLLINSGDFVDLALTDDRGTRIVAQNIKVLAFYADPNPSQTTDRPISQNTVAFEVTAVQAEALIQLRTMGVIRMILRNFKDNVEIRTKGFSSEEIRDNPNLVQSRGKQSLGKAEEVAAEIKAKSEAEKSQPNVSTTPTPAP